MKYIEVLILCVKVSRIKSDDYMTMAKTKDLIFATHVLRLWQRDRGSRAYRILVESSFFYYRYIGYARALHTSTRAITKA